MQQGNEKEALRSWRNALDQIYYHNAYRVPPGYVPRSETEKALKDSLRDLENQCKERVDLLEALRASRKEQAASEGGAASSAEEHSGKIQKMSSRKPKNGSDIETSAGEKGYIGNGTIPAVSYPDLSRPPPLPQRPAMMTKNSSEQAVVGSRLHNSLLSSSSPAGPSPRVSSGNPVYSPMLAPPMKKTSRSPSPEKRTMLHTLRSGDRRKPKPKVSKSSKEESLLTNKAASLAWTSTSRKSGERDRLGRPLDPETNHSSSALPEGNRRASSSDPLAAGNVKYDSRTRRLIPDPAPTPPDIFASSPYGTTVTSNSYPFPSSSSGQHGDSTPTSSLPGPFEPEYPSTMADPPRARRTPPPPPPHSKNTSKLEPLPYPTYLKEYPDTTAKKSSSNFEIPLRRKGGVRDGESSSSRVSRKPVAANISSPRRDRHLEKDEVRRTQRRHSKSRDDDTSSLSVDDDTNSSGPSLPKPKRKTKLKQKQKETPVLADPATPNSDSDVSETTAVEDAWKLKVASLMKNLPKGVDEGAAKQIFNEIVVQGDEVHWEDVAGLDIAKKALKEAVVYPFLRPDLFMGLREPARGMLLFGPPGTGKTMLARAVATESRSTFFSISASSLTSKYLGESEKLVRALFSLAKALAPSIIFVDEIDSLLSSRSGSGEHEATRRIKTEFLIQWSDLQRAAAGREQSDKEKERGDASRVLVLAATNLPWAIDEAARRRFVRRQYIPLPEDETRATQLRTLIGHQKHNLEEEDIERLVELTDGMLLRACPYSPI